MSYTNILYSKKERVARISINRPEVYNAFNLDTLQELIDAFNDAVLDADVGVIVLSGEGGNFSVGGDIKWEKNFDLCKGKEMTDKCLVLSNLMRNSGKPIIAAVRGYCIGGGNELNMLCDVTIATEKSFFGQAGPRVGSAPIWYGTQMLPRVVGEKKAREIVYWCRKYPAHEAERMGMINKVVKDDELEAEVQRWCDEVLEMSPQAIRLCKLSLNFESDALYPSVLNGMAMVVSMYGTEEFNEGMTAFIEKRKPRFYGKGGSSE